jgi:hypothetical protein
MPANHTPVVHRNGRRRVIGAAVTALMAASVPVGASAQTLTGSGRLITETRDVRGFSAIRLDGAFNVVARLAQAESVQVQADDNLIPLIETLVEDRKGVPTLVLRVKRGAGYRTRSPVVVTVDARALEALTLAGSGDIRASGIRGETLTVELGGSGDVTLDDTQVSHLQIRLAGSGDVRGQGRAEKLDVALAGSGDIRLSTLIANAVTVNLAGSGDVDVHADQSLSVTLRGSGDVRYRGGATAIQSSVLGSGSVKRR